MNHKSIERIIIFGRPGSGKSTFAQKLHTIYHIPLYHLDKYFYDANWVERDYQSFLNDQNRIVQQEHWILDGTATKSLEMRYARANICIYFNMPRILCIYRILKRLLQNADSSSCRPDNCPEKFSWKLLKYSWTFESRVSDQILKLKAKYPEVRFFEIKNNKDIEKIEQILRASIKQN